MVRSCVFGLFAITLCLVACLCANAETERDANKAADVAKTSANNVLKRAQEDVKNAQTLLNDLKTYKKNAEEAATKAEKAAEGNKEAKVIALKAKDASAKVLNMYSSATASANAYSAIVKELHTKANTLYGEATKCRSIKADKDGDYTKRKETADGIKKQAEDLDKEIDTPPSQFKDAFSAQTNMLKLVTDAQLAEYQVDAVVADAKIETLWKSAEADITLTGQKREETSTAVEKLKKLHDDSPENLKQYIFSFYTLAQGRLSSASSAVEGANKAKNDMLEQKTKAKNVLLKLKTETDVKKAEEEADIALSAANQAKQNADDIKKSLLSATHAASDALIQKGNAVRALERDKDKANPSNPDNVYQPVKDAAESPVGSGAKQPTRTNPGQPVSGREEPIRRAGSDNTALSDSAITVSVSLLLALITCAAMH